MKQSNVVILKGKLTDLKRVARTLTSAGIPSEIIRPPVCNINS